ncbi:MAG: hotdog fold thioesterase [Pyrinomonadaceae bacterium]|nr:hotdog fold thioesterase [Pyrinomonadaceae bacterium]
MNNLELITKSDKVTVLKTLGIEIISATAEKVVLEMTVDERHHQPMGILHGGVSVVLAETAASLGAMMAVDLTKQTPVGVEINANHLRSAKSGKLTTIATPSYHGRTLSVWNIEIKDERDKIICISRCTIALKTGGIVP